MTETVTTPDFVAGLEGIVAAQTRLSSVDGQAGQLIIAGFPVEELVSRASFEETVYLLWRDILPSGPELAAFRHELAAQRNLSAVTLDLLQAAASQKVATIDALLMAAGTLTLQRPSDSQQQALTLAATFPAIVAAYWRLLNGQEPLAPRPDLGHAANYLYMLFGQTPRPEHVRGLETYLNTVIDHGMNASTFTARVIISTQSDVVSAVVGALGALKGPLHGGAPGPALDMVFEIGDAANAEAYLRRKLEQGERLMGFGHRVYKVRDPRAEVLSAAAAQMYQGNGHQALYQLSRQVEQTDIALLAEYKPGRNLQTNVEFYTALLLHGLGLPTELFTPTFAMGRVAGWIAHCFEQQALNRLIRPQSVYIGPKDRRWIPLEQRSG
ncbi:MAG TPA: citrate synthase/methylcitrate synthase [Anaerolineae bacterium]|nr:citrate synthase/methylcitrate synthase [Anaerolineae bacterium]